MRGIPFSALAPCFFVLAYTTAHAAGGLETRTIPSPIRTQHLSGNRPTSANGIQQQVDPAAQEATDLMNLRRTQQQAYNGMNQVNPTSQDFDPKLTPQLRAIMQSKVFQGYVKLVTDPKFQANAQTVMTSPSRFTLLLAEIGWIIFMLFFRAWRFSKADVWYERVWTGVWTGGLFILGTSVVLPFAILGDPYMKVVSSILEVWF